MIKEVNWEKIIKDYKNGISISKLSKIYELPYYTVNNYLINNNFKIVNIIKFPMR